jgi:glyoxylase-like metal-dependent hydrolase (beta-lactamase superfamily II)
MKRRDFSLLMGGSTIAMHPAMSTLTRLFAIDEFTMKPLRGNVGYYTESGGTIVWQIEDGAVVIVDTQFPEQAGHLIKEVEKKTDAAIDLIINTHHHGDHTSGNIVFKGLAKHIVAHANSKTNQKASAESKGKLDQVLLPDTTFIKEWKQTVGSESITMLYWGAGHTDGDALTHFENANVVHMGDLVFNRRYPYIDKGAGASIENWINVLDRTREHYDNDTIFVCGHSANGHDIVINKGDIAAFSDYLGKLLKFVDGELKSGKSEDEIMAATEIPGAPEWKGKGIGRSLSAAYTELATGK